MAELLTTKVTSLEMREAPANQPIPPIGAPDLRLDEASNMSLDHYRWMYRAVGDPHHWTSRILPDSLLAKEIHNPSTRIFVLREDDQVAGWFELEMRYPIRETRIVHFAIMPNFRRRGLAHYMLDRAIAAAFADGIERIIIETNTLDHPAALGLYQNHGFQPYAVRQVLTPAIDPGSASPARKDGVSV